MTANAQTNMNVAGQVCLVPGGTSGLGKAIALAFASMGAHVVTGSRSEDKVEAVKAELQDAADHGAKTDAIVMDVSDEQSIKNAIDHVAQTFGRLDSLVNASGIIQKTPALEMSTEDFDKIQRINLTGSFIVAREAAKIMKDQTPRENTNLRGSMVMIASLNSYISLSDVLAYACSKSGVLGLIRGLANEWSQYGLRVNGIAPGVFPTDLNRQLIEGTPRGDWLLNHTPQGRFGQADEIVGAAQYLVADAASFTNGHTIVVDGGFLSRGA